MAALLAAGALDGGRIVSATDVYGASYALMSRLLPQAGTRTRFVDAADLVAVAAAVEETRPTILYCETISNPLLKVADLPELARIAHEYGAKLVVDNTFASPYLCRPIEQGADVVIHSATKYLSGHGDVMAGVVACSAEVGHELRENQKLLGANLAPQAASLVLRGIKTLVLRMRKQCENAVQIAAWLDARSDIARVNYPGLAGHPQHELATALFAGLGYGGMMSFDIQGATRQDVFRFMDALNLVTAATTLGDVFSLVLYPAHSSHRQLPKDVRAAMGITDGLVRMSAGIEAVEDIISDLDQALALV